MTTSITSIRGAPDSTTILYLGRSASGDHSALYEIGFLGGPPRPIVPALTGGDISRLDGLKIAVFQMVGGVVKLVVVRLDGTPLKRWFRVRPGGGRKDAALGAGRPIDRVHRLGTNWVQ